MVKARVKKSAKEATPAPPVPVQPRKNVADDDGGASQPPAGTDLLSQTVFFCQNQRWREAAVTCRRVLERARNEGNVELQQSMTGALTKIEYSLRRQMVAAAVCATQDLLAKEFLLDVGNT